MKNFQVNSQDRVARKDPISLLGFPSASDVVATAFTPSFGRPLFSKMCQLFLKLATLSLK